MIWFDSRADGTVRMKEGVVFAHALEKIGHFYFFIVFARDCFIF